MAPRMFSLVEKEIAKELDHWHHRAFVSTADLAAAVGRPIAQVRRKVFEMISKGLVEQGTMGGFRLTSKGRSAYRAQVEG